MKRIISLFALVVTSILVMTNCAKEIDQPIDKNDIIEGVPFEIVANPVETKTVNDGLNTKWEAEDQINLFHAIKDSDDYKIDGAFTVSDIETGAFTGTLNGELLLEAGKSYDWYALYPYRSEITSPTGNSYTYIGYKGGLIQNEYDSKAHLSDTKCPLYGKVSTEGTATPSISMQHLSSVVALKVKNATTAPMTITSASFTADDEDDIVGSYYINYAGPTVSYTASDPNYVSNTASLTVKNGTELAVGESATLYIVIKPFTAVSGESLTIAVNGYSKTVEMTKDVEFSPGVIKTIPFNYNKLSAAAKTWSLVQNIEDLVDGEYAILATTDNLNYGYLPSTTTNSNPSFASQAVLNPSNKVASVAVEDAMIWSLVQNVGDTYSFVNTSDKYFYGTNAAQGLRVGDTKDEFRVSVHPTNPNAFAMQSVNGTRYVGVYNTDWRSYTSLTANEYKVTIDEDVYEGLKSQLYFFYCGTIPSKTKLSAPTNVTAQLQNVNEIVVTWDAVANAGSYDVTCGSTTINTTNTSYTFTELNYNTDYVVSVRARSGDKSTYYSSDPVSIEKVTTEQPLGMMTYSWTLEKNDLGVEGNPLSSAVEKGDPARDWALVFTWANESVKYLGFEASNSARGLQIGKADKSGTANHCDGLSLTTSEFESVNYIKVNASMASSGNTSLSVTVGGQPLTYNGNNSVSLTTSSTEYEFVTATPLDGDVVITLTNTGIKGFYLKSISINK